MPERRFARHCYHSERAVTFFESTVLRARLAPWCAFCLDLNSLKEAKVMDFKRNSFELNSFIFTVRDETQETNNIRNNTQIITRIIFIKSSLDFILAIQRMT